MSEIRKIHADDTDYREITNVGRAKDVIFQRDRIIKVSLARRSKRNVVYRMLIQLSGRSGRYSVCLLRLLFGMP